MEAKCPNCQAALNYDSKFFGRKFKCATCFRVIEIDKQGIPRLVAPKAPPAQAVKPAPVDTRPIVYKCQHCKGALETDGWMAMKEEECPFCGQVNQVPSPKAQGGQSRV